MLELVGLVFGEAFVDPLVAEVVGYGSACVELSLEEAASQVLVCVDSNVIIVVMEEVGHLKSSGSEVCWAVLWKALMEKA